MEGAVLRFPETGKKVRAIPEPEVHLEHLGVDSAKELLPLVRDRLAKSEAFLRQLSTRRKEIRRRGLESTLIEISSIVDGNRVQSVRDALEESISKNRGVDITQAALDRVHRLDILVAEATELMIPDERPLPAPEPRALPWLAGPRSSDGLSLVLGVALVLSLAGAVTYALLRRSPQ